MAEIATAYIGLIPSTRGFSGKLEAGLAPQIQKSGSKIGGLLGKSLKVGAVGVAASAGALIGTSLAKGFSRLNAIDQATAKLRGLGNSAQSVDKIMGNALASVKGTAFGLDEAATVAASAVASGIKPGAALTKTLKLVADAATIGGTSMSDMGLIFNKVAATGKLNGEVIQQLGERGIPILQLLAKQLKVTPAEVSKMASEGKVGFDAFSKAMKQGLGGAAQESGKTFTGAWKNMQASLGRIGANLLAGVFPKMTSGIAGITGALSKMEPVATKVGAAIGSGLSGAVSKASDAFARLRSQAGQPGGALEKLSAAGQQFSEFVATNLLPAVSAVGQYLRDTWGPILAQIGGLVATKVAPILASLAGFLYGRLYPAIFQIVQVVATNLKPVFDQLAATMSTQILPAVSRMLDRLRPLSPVLAVVASVSLKVLGILAKLASKVLGVVLPVLIQMTGFLAGTLFDTIGAMAEYFVKGGDAVGRFASKINKGIGKAVKFVTGLPGKIKGAIGDAATMLVSKGWDIIRGLVSGIKSAADSLISGAIKFVTDKIPGPFKKLMGIKSPSRVMMPIGYNIGAGVAVGIESSAERVGKAAKKLGKKALKKLRDTLEKKTDKKTDLTNTLTDMISGISSAYMPDLFSGSLGNLTKGLTAGLAGVRNVFDKAIPKLKAAGLDFSGGFFQQLMASGNTQLITALAANPSLAKQYESQYKDLADYSSKIGNTVARASTEGQTTVAAINKVTAKLDKIEKVLKANDAKAHGKATASALDKTAGKAKKGKAKR